MLVIPAIDLVDGQCVRLQRGDMARKTIFSSDPAAVAARWEESGARVLHMVDLDGAVSGESKNLTAVEQVVKRLQIPVELGGGLRTRDDVARVLDLGVHWAIMGTSALANRPELEACVAKFPGRIIVGIDARDGKVAVSGWTQTSKVSALELALQVQALGVARIIFTDIATDGMLQGPNLDSVQELAATVNVGVIASGGVTTLEDIRRLRHLEPLGVVGCIVGRALYSGTLDLREAISAGTR
jgi:phosphoribosylformimino-5-aminoimidazole carboxamide ribotide isomerase